MIVVVQRHKQTDLIYFMLVVLVARLEELLMEQAARRSANMELAEEAEQPQLPAMLDQEETV